MAKKLLKPYELLPLSIFAVNGRYAVINDDLSDAEKYIKILNDILEFVKKTIAEKSNT